MWIFGYHQMVGPGRGMVKDAEERARMRLDEAFRRAGFGTVATVFH